MSYATTTTVAVTKTKADIEKLLVERYGAKRFASMIEPGAAHIAFEMHGRHIRLSLPLPDRQAQEYTHRLDGRTQSYKPRTEVQATAAWEQACRSRWRALLLVIQALCEAVEVGIMTFEQAFLMYTMLPSGATVGEDVGHRVATMIESGTMGALQLTTGSR